MRRLSGTDALFLSMETPAWHQHVGGLMILDPEGREVTYDTMLALIGERIAPGAEVHVEAQAGSNEPRSSRVDR